MDRNEYTLKLAEIILNDWRKAMTASGGNGPRFCLPGDTVDIAFRAMQKAYELANDYYE